MTFLLIVVFEAAYSKKQRKWGTHEPIFSNRARDRAGVNHANAFFDGIMRAHNFYRHVAEPAEGALKLASQLLLG